MHVLPEWYAGLRMLSATDRWPSVVPPRPEVHRWRITWKRQLLVHHSLRTNLSFSFSCRSACWILCTRNWFLSRRTAISACSTATSLVLDLAFATWNQHSQTFSRLRSAPTQDHGISLATGMTARWHSVSVSKLLVWQGCVPGMHARHTVRQATSGSVGGKTHAVLKLAAI
jgi:hypothetical protein